MRPHESTRHFPPSPITKLASGLVAASLGYAIEERGEKVVSLEKAAQVSFVKQNKRKKEHHLCAVFRIRTAILLNGDHKKRVKVQAVACRGERRRETPSGGMRCSKFHGAEHVRATAGNRQDKRFRSLRFEASRTTGKECT